VADVNMTINFLSVKSLDRILHAYISMNSNVILSKAQMTAVSGGLTTIRLASAVVLTAFSLDLAQLTFFLIARRNIAMRHLGDYVFQKEEEVDDGGGQTKMASALWLSLLSQAVVPPQMQPQSLPPPPPPPPPLLQLRQRLPPPLHPWKPLHPQAKKQALVHPCLIKPLVPMM
jgi:hypothetical protein